MPLSYFWSMSTVVAISPDARKRVRTRVLRYTTTFLGPALVATALFAHGIWCWAFPLYAFVLVPLLELMNHPDHGSLSEEEEQAALDDPLFDRLLYAVVPVQWTVLVLFLFQVGEPGLGAWDLAGRIASMGMLCGIHGINVAHELGHRATRLERNMARALLLTSLYMHFIIEHNRGHHKRVATPDDPASARYGESIYVFWLRSILFGFRSAWRIEAERLRRAGRSPLGFRNEMVQGLCLQGALLITIGVVFGITTLFAFLIAATIGILLLETVNYIEHYGLRRKISGQGGYKRVQHFHSWNSDHLVGRAMLFELTRHSDHHWKASRKYQILQGHIDAPQLPTGYPGMMVLSLVPPLFFRVVHPHLARMARQHADLELAA